MPTGSGTTLRIAGESRRSRSGLSKTLSALLGRCQAQESTGVGLVGRMASQKNAQELSCVVYMYFQVWAEMARHEPGLEEIVHKE